MSAYGAGDKLSATYAGLVGKTATARNYTVEDWAYDCFGIPKKEKETHPPTTGRVQHKEVWDGKGCAD